MRNVIKYRTNVVLCLVVALSFAMKLSIKNQQKHVWIVFFHLNPCVLLSVQGRSVGSFCEQRLVIEPTLVYGVQKLHTDDVTSLRFDWSGSVRNLLEPVRCI